MSKTMEIQKADKPKMSYLEALDAIQKYDAAIKEAAKIRISQEVSADDDICGYSGKKVCLSALGLVIASLLSPIVGIDGNPQIALVSASTLGGMISAIATSCFTAPAKFVSPIKYKKLLAEEKYEKGLIAIKEAEFMQVEQAVLKKAKKVRKVIDRHLLSQNKFSEYNGRKGHEGFKIS